LKQIAVRRDQMARANRARRDGNNIEATPVPGQRPFSLLQVSMTSTRQGWAARNVSFDRPGSELVDVEGPVESSVKLLAKPTFRD